IPTTIDMIRFFYIYQSDVWIWVAIGLVFLDIVTGLIKAWVTKVINSSVGIKGLGKHFTVILFAIAVYPIMVYLTFEEAAWAMLALIAVTYAISIIENCVVLGMPIHKFVVKRLEKVKET
ncbi:phage holin family protein, partial [Streptococcus suis]